MVSLVALSGHYYSIFARIIHVLSFPDVLLLNCWDSKLRMAITVASIDHNFIVIGLNQRSSVALMNADR